MIPGMEPTDELTHSLERDKVRRAVAMSEEQRFLSALELFEMASEMTRAGIRADHPEADERRVTELLQRRLSLARRLEVKA
jgi:Rv0078B-related antitoxin